MSTQQDKLDELERSFAEAAIEILEARPWRETLHPRGRAGQFVDVLGKLATKPERDPYFDPHWWTPDEPSRSGWIGANLAGGPQMSNRMARAVTRYSPGKRREPEEPAAEVPGYFLSMSVVDGRKVRIYRVGNQFAVTIDGRLLGHYATKKQARIVGTARARKKRKLPWAEPSLGLTGRRPLKEVGMDSIERAAAEARRVKLEEIGLWRETLHPRGRKGQFVDVLGKLTKGQSVAVPGATVTRTEHGWHYLPKEGGMLGGPSFKTAAEAAEHVARFEQEGRPKSRPSAPKTPEQAYKEAPKLGDQGRAGLEGPFRYRSGWEGYYDPKEGRYYDAKTDMYMPRDFDPDTGEGSWKGPRKRKGMREGVMTTQDKLAELELALGETTNSVDTAGLWAREDILLSRLASEIEEAAADDEEEETPPKRKRKKQPVYEAEDAVDEVEFSTQQREKLAAKGHAMPHGGYPIRNVGDLKRAIRAIGRAKNRAATIAWIKKRAKALGATNLLPSAWGSA